MKIGEFCGINQFVTKMVKKKFIDGSGQHFHLLHRSQRDEAYANDEAPSEFVLVPSNKKINTNKFIPDNSNSNSNIAPLSTSYDHINQLGFKNDGYDYTQHLKVVSGGTYIGKDGKVAQRIIPNLPDDVFASEKELDRNFQAITISEGNSAYKNTRI